MTTEPPSNVPATIGPFQLLHPLGSGGMGTVYLARRIDQFAQQVAIKILHPHLFPDTARASLEHEGQILAALNHPSIVRILDHGITPAGQHYIVMEYVEGAPIDTYCKEKNLTTTQRIRLFSEVLEAVDYAHRHLVIHADLKPENILVTAEGKPRLLDFGVASFLSEPGSTTKLESASYTARYASPEQQSGERLTVASDIYSLGLVGRLLLTIDPPTRNRDLEAILAKALQPDPKDRFQSAQDFLEDLERHRLGYPIRSRRTSRLTRVRKLAARNKLAAAAAIVLSLVVAFSAIGVVVRAREAAHKREIANNRLQELVRLTDALAGELYDSVRGLAGAESAQAALLKSAHQTIDALASEDVKDEQVQIELAHEYEKLARLELDRKPLTREDKQTAASDLDKGINLIANLPIRDTDAIAARRSLPAMHQLRDSIQIQQAK